MFGVNPVKTQHIDFKIFIGYFIENVLSYVNPILIADQRQK